MAEKTIVELDRDTAEALLPAIEQYMRIRTKRLAEGMQKLIDPVLAGRPSVVSSVLLSIEESVGTERALLDKIEAFQIACLKISESQ